MSDKRNIQDQQRRLLAEKYELRRKLYKAFSKDTDLPNDVREKHRCKLADLPRNSSFTRAVNRCVFTGRARSVYQMFRVSRIVFRDLASRANCLKVGPLFPSAINPNHSYQKYYAWIVDTEILEALKYLLLFGRVLESLG
uniref:Small ribosomal subunit protein uS14c n=1 Tax=Lactuca sativa TaxID=4236 RepID=A0A9R1UI51_LACSA|nr:hypothetical protein LSAT_V11C900460690 [Lactuca sativa]